MKLKRELKKAIGGTVGLRLFSVAATFLASVLLARFLGVEDFGFYSFVYALVTLVALPCQVGIPVLLVRETAKFESLASWGKIKGLWFWAGKTTLITSLVACLFVLFYLLVMKEDNNKDFLLTYLFALIMIPLIALGNCRAAALRGLRKIIQGQLPDAVVRPGIFLLLIVGAVVLGEEGGAWVAMAFNALAAAIAFIIGAYLLVYSSPPEVAKSGQDTSESKQWLRSAIPLALIGGLQVISNQIGIILLGVFHEDAVVGIYKVAISVATFLAFGLQIINMIVSPYAARFSYAGEKRKLQKIAALGAAVGMLISIPLFLIIIMAGEDLLTMIYGSEFSMAAYPLIILAFGQLANTFFGSTGVILNMTGHEKLAAKWLSVSAVCNLIVASMVIPTYGAVGAAAATVFSILIWNVAFWVLAKKKTGVDGSALSLIGLLGRGK